MNTILKNNDVNFKSLEKYIFSEICKIGQEVTRNYLESYDQVLAEERDKKKYRHKGRRTSTIKTVYGEVTYSRTVYQFVENGKTQFVYLLDEALGLKEVGMFSSNVTELIVSGITELSYRECAKKVTEMTGQAISTMGVWQVVQKLGEKVCNVENDLVEDHKNGRIQGEKEVPVLFEEADGVYINLQGKDRKTASKGRAEVKVAIAYDGWKEKGNGRYELSEKVVVAGLSKAKDFHEYREAAIAQIYNLDEVTQRILNADGASWIKKVKDKSTCFQLDPFHRNKAVRENIHHPKAVNDILELLGEKKIDEMFEYLETYQNSLDDDKEMEEVENLRRYFWNNRNGLLPYQEQGLELPRHPEGLKYRNMGTMENHIWSVIARRMKHHHRSWSRQGGNYLAKILAKKASGRLHEVIHPLGRSEISKEAQEEVLEWVQSVAQTPKKEGKGYDYPTSGHIPQLDTKLRGARKSLLAMAGF